MTVVRLPWPTGPLWPNRRPHWTVHRRHAAIARKDAWALTLSAKASGTDLQFTFHPPRRPGLMNIDGCIAALKSSVDGIADAIGVDDSEFRISWPLTFSEPVKGGMIVVEFEEA